MAEKTAKEASDLRPGDVVVTGVADLHVAEEPRRDAQLYVHVRVTDADGRTRRVTYPPGALVAVANVVDRLDER